MDIVFVNKCHFWERTKKEWFKISKELEKKIILLTDWTNSPKDFEKTSYFTERMIFEKRIFFNQKNDLLNERFYWKNDFTERTILLNERFDWTIVQWENEQNRWKMNDNFEKERNKFFWNNKKTGRNRSFMNDKRELKKNRTRPSLLKRE